MASFFGYYQLLPRPHRDAVFLSLPNGSRGVLLFQNITFHSVRKEKMVQNFRNDALSTKRGHISLWCSINSKQDDSREPSVKKIETSSLFSAYEGIILANSMILILPFQTLAETCKADYSALRMALLFSVAFVGATVGGLLARKRKGDLKRINGQLRQINETLRRQAMIESYAPDLSYAPVGRMAAKEVVVDPRREKLISNLRNGKSFLRTQDYKRATEDFRLALDLAQAMGDQAEEKKAARGLGASLQRQGKFREAIMYYSRVLALSKLDGEDSATTEAYGAIADCFTELGDLERAAKFYDKYINRLKEN